MPSFWKHVNSVLEQAEIIIEVLDGRLIEESRNREIEEKVKRMNKKLLFVINKCDLVEQKKMEEAKRKLHPSLFVSCREHFGTTMLKKKILELSKGKETVVGIVGYPNVGKSSLINALSGRGSARTSPESGFTKGLQKVRVDKRILLIDTPGVLPYLEKNEGKHVLMSTIDYGKIKDPETAALQIITDKTELVRDCYQVKGDNPEEILEEIAMKFNRLQKGGEPDLEATGRIVIKDWQAGKMKKEKA